jgi:uncharacterized membrane protein
MDYIVLESVSPSSMWSSLIGMTVATALFFTMIAAVNHEWRRNGSTAKRFFSASTVLAAFIGIALLLVHLFMAPSFEAASRNADSFTKAYAIDDLSFTNRNDYASLMSSVRNDLPSTSVFTATDRRDGSINSYKVVIDSSHRLKLFKIGEASSTKTHAVKTVDPRQV